MVRPRLLYLPPEDGPPYYPGDDEGLYNPRLHRKYLVREGIPVMLIDEAVAVDDAGHEAIMTRVSSEGLAPTFAA